MALLTPAMTSNTAPAPWVVSATSTLVAGDEYLGYDQGADVWAFSAALPQSSQIFTGGDQIEPTRFRFKTRAFLWRYPRDFEIFYSDDGIIWTSAGSFFQADTLLGDQYSPWFTLASAPAKYWKIEVTTANEITPNFGIAAIEFDNPNIFTDLDGVTLDRDAGQLAFSVTITANLDGVEVDRGAGQLTASLMVGLDGVDLDRDAGQLDHIIGPPQPTPQSFEIFRAILTGAPNIEIKTDNISIRRRAESPTFVQVVLADPSQIEDIEARANGELIVYQGLFFPETNTESLYEIARGDLSRVDTSKGTARESTVLVGYGDIPASNPKDVSLESVDFIASGTSGQRARGSIDNQIRPGDTATVVSEGMAFIVNEIVYRFGPGLISMEVQE